MIYGPIERILKRRLAKQIAEKPPPPLLLLLLSLRPDVNGEETTFGSAFL